ncbi:NDUB9 dehydrogenase, partial [Atractosteus spatula]|nr:NDUB9 dehydrogenase [Atractosteus spatula]
MASAYLTHQQKVLRLYKKSLRHLESWYIFRDIYRFHACLLRARFDQHKNEKDMVKATLLLKAGEEEFWEKQHPQPYIFPDSPGGTSYERYERYKVGGCEHLTSHKLHCPPLKCTFEEISSSRSPSQDPLASQKWHHVIIQQLQEETPADGPKTEALPPARKEGDLPPLWWQYVTRPRERPT